MSIVENIVLNIIFWYYGSEFDSEAATAPLFSSPVTLSSAGTYTDTRKGRMFYDLQLGMQEISLRKLTN